jgi:hypothetical protein
MHGRCVQSTISTRYWLHNSLVLCYGFWWIAPTSSFFIFHLIEFMKGKRGKKAKIKSHTYAFWSRKDVRRRKKNEKKSFPFTFFLLFLSLIQFVCIFYESLPCRIRKRVVDKWGPSKNGMLDHVFHSVRYSSSSNIWTYNKCRMTMDPYSCLEKLGSLSGLEQLSNKSGKHMA